MLIFGSLSDSNFGITPDYFGDELALPLPQSLEPVKNEAVDKTIVRLKPEDDSGNLAIGNARQTMPKGIKKIAESRELRSGEPAFAPCFDELNWFESFVIKDSK